MCLVGVLLGQVGTDVEQRRWRGSPSACTSLDDGDRPRQRRARLLRHRRDREEPRQRARSARRSRARSSLIPTWPEFKRIIPSALRGSVAGSVLGLMPGGGPVIAQFAAYALDKKFSKYRARDRSGRDRGRRRPGRGGRGGGAHQLHPADEHRHSRERRHGADDGGVHHQGHPARPEHDRRTPGPVLGPGCEHVDRQLLPAAPERAAGPLLACRCSRSPTRVLFPAILFFCCIGTFSVNNNLERHLHHRLLRRARLHLHAARASTRRR